MKMENRHQRQFVARVIGVMLLCIHNRAAAFSGTFPITYRCQIVSRPLHVKRQTMQMLQTTGLESVSEVRCLMEQSQKGSAGIY